VNGGPKLKANKLVILTLLALLGSAMACGGSRGEKTPTPAPTSTPTPTAGYLTYTDEANGFSISYPEDWNTMPQQSLEAGLIGFEDPEC